MKTPNPDVDPFVEALRGDLPSTEDEARVRARLIAAGVLVTGAAFTASSAAATSSPGVATAALEAGAAGGVGAASGAGTSGVVAAGAFGSGAAAAGGVAGSAGGALGAGAPVALVKAGLLSKVLVLPLAAKVGVATTLAVAVAATSVPLVLEGDAPEARAVAARAAQPADLSRAEDQGRAAEARSSSEASATAPAPLASREVSGRAEAALPSAGTTAARAPVTSLVPRMEGAAADETAASPSPRERRLASTSAGSPDGVESATRQRRTTKSPTPARGSAQARVAEAPRPPAPAAERAPGVTASSEGGSTELVRASSLGEETRLMERAMVALGEGEREVALHALEEHARRFPDGLLQRERERALARLQRSPADPPATDSAP